MTKSGNQYTADFSEYELGSLGDGNTTDVNITFFTSDRLSKTVSISMDNQAPTRPALATAGDLKSVTLTSSDDTKYFYAYSGDINDSSPASGGTLVESNITASNGKATFNLCSAATSFSTNVGAYRFTAVDSDTATSLSYAGDIDYNRVSDIGYLDDTNYSATIYPIYKNASILSVTDTATPDSLPSDYNSSCENTGISTTDHAVKLTSINDADVVIAFEKNVSEFSNAAPADLVTVNLAVDNTEVAQVLFDSSKYKNAGQKFLMQYDGKIYSTGWQVIDSNESGTINFTDSNVTMLTGQTIVKPTN
jgi:hypothetical protein